MMSIKILKIGLGLINLIKERVFIAWLILTEVVNYVRVNINVIEKSLFPTWLNSTKIVHRVNFQERWLLLQKMLLILKLKFQIGVLTRVNKLLKILIKVQEKVASFWKRLNEFEKEKAMLKQELTKLAERKFILESENIILKQKCQELEQELIKKGECPHNEATGGCDCVANLKYGVLELLSREFNCCICKGMLVDAIVTKCNHVFCAYCLKETKKKDTNCPICKTPRILERSVQIIDEYIMNMVKLLSDERYAQRVQLVEERKSIAAKKMPRREDFRKVRILDVNSWKTPYYQMR